MSGSISAGPAGTGCLRLSASLAYLEFEWTRYIGQAYYDNLVFVIEYRGQDFDQGCSEFPELSIVLRDLNLTTPSASSYVFDGC